MPENLEGGTSEPEKPITYMDFLSRLDEITNADIARLREHVLPGLLADFDKDAGGTNDLLALLFKSSDEELRNIIALGFDCEIVGIHKIQNHLMLLTQITGDPRFLQIWQNKEKPKIKGSQITPRAVV